MKYLKFFSGLALMLLPIWVWSFLYDAFRHQWWEKPFTFTVFVFTVIGFCVITDTKN